MMKLPNDKYALKYHLMPQMGWLNDPNGLCRFNDTTHIFFQYSEDPQGGLKQWGHYTTKDYINYQLHNLALKPDIPADKDGVYSGSAIIVDGMMHLYYTGNVKYEGDRVMTGRDSNVIHVASEDGFNFTPKEVVLTNEDYPDNLTRHVRDPKIFVKNGQYQMVLGARDINDCGLVLLYQSADLIDWHYAGELTSASPLGYMWECPDYLQLDGQELLLCCPQGVATSGDQFQPLYNNGYFPVAKDQLGEFEELDIGFDFYAPQTYQDGDRTIMIGWMGMPDVEYRNANANQWQHCLTIPRELKYREGHLCQTPLVELRQLRQGEFTIANQNLATNCFELHLDVIPDDFELTLRDEVTITYRDKLLTLTMNGAGLGRDERILKLDRLDNLTIFSDVSSLEIFVNDGIKTITTRVYGDSTALTTNGMGKGYYLGAFQVEISV